MIGNRIGSQIEVEYVYQELTDLPEGFTVPEGRKTMGNRSGSTGVQGRSRRAVCDHQRRRLLRKRGFRKLHDFLVNGKQEGEVLNMAMAGFVLKILSARTEQLPVGSVPWMTMIC